MFTHRHHLSSTLTVTDSPGEEVALIPLRRQMQSVPGPLNNFGEIASGIFYRNQAETAPVAGERLSM